MINISLHNEISQSAIKTIVDFVAVNEGDVADILRILTTVAAVLVYTTVEPELQNLAVKEFSEVLPRRLKEIQQNMMLMNHPEGKPN